MVNPMKKFLLLLLVGAMLLSSCVALASCDLIGGGEHTAVDEDGDGKCDVCGQDMPAKNEPHEAIDKDGDGKCDTCGQNMPEIADTPDLTADDFVAYVQAHSPAKVTTVVNYTTASDTLKGKYVTMTEDDIVVFRYEYDRFATVDEEADSRIVHETGTVYYKDGRIFDGEELTDDAEWTAVTPAGINVGLDLEKCKAAATVNGSVLSVVLSGEAIREVLGTDLGASGDVALAVTVNNTYLNNVKIEYTSANGAGVVVETSYTYDTSESADVALNVAIANVSSLCRVSNPTKISTVATQKTGVLTEVSRGVMTIGMIDGKRAATYVRSVQTLTNVENAGIETPINTTTNTWEYIEGVGSRLNGGEWDADSIDIAPAAGFLNFRLAGNYENASYENGVLSFIVPAAKVSAALGSFLNGETVDADVKVSISNAGGVISSIVLEYTLEADEESGAINPNDVEVRIEATYSYDLEEITIA